MISELGGEGKTYKLLEMFKGTGSVGKVAKQLGWNVISLDLDPIFTPDIETDILDWDYKKYQKDNNYKPDFIWASPPCNTYSPLAYPLKERDTKTAEPKSDRAKLGTKILYKTLEIIDYFKEINPNLLFIIENPRGMMRHDKKIQKLILNSTLYCLYGDERRKPTDFFSNFEMSLKDDTQCPNKTIPVVDISLKDRYKIPSRLVKDMLLQMKDEYTKMKGDGLFTREPGVLPPAARKLLSQVGSEQVQSFKLVRTPLSSSTRFLLNLATFGQYEKALKDINVDKFFHLRAIINDKYSLEKNEVIRFYKSNKIESGAEVLDVIIPQNNPTSIQEMMDKTKAQMGDDKFTSYNAQDNNCGVFLNNVLSANGWLNSKSSEFTLQETEKLFSKFPSLSKMLVNLGTKAGAVASRLIEGEGKGDKYAVEEEKSIFNEREALGKLAELNRLPDYPRFKEKLSDSEVKLIAKYDAILAYFRKLARYEKTLTSTQFVQKGILRSLLKSVDEIVDKRIPSESSIFGKGHCQCGGRISKEQIKPPSEMRGLVTEEQLLAEEERIRDIQNEMATLNLNRLRDVNRAIRLNNELMTILRFQRGGQDDIREVYEIPRAIQDRPVSQIEEDNFGDQEITEVSSTEQINQDIDRLTIERSNVRQQIFNLGITEDERELLIQRYNELSNTIDSLLRERQRQLGGMEAEVEPTNPDIERVSSLRRTADRLYADIKNIVDTGNVMAFAGGFPTSELIRLRDMKNRYNLIINQIEAITGETEERKVLPILIYQKELSGSGYADEYGNYNFQLKRAKLLF